MIAVAIAAREAAADVPFGPTHPAVRTTALFAAAAWGMVAAVMLLSSPRGWDSGDRRFLQMAWLLAWSLFAIHVAAAFHFAHGWSHAVAVAHVEKESGAGEGIFVSYLFTLVWGADALWLAARPESYVRRPRWVAWTVHGLLAFVTFNATVVYGAGLARWGGAVGFAVLAYCFVQARNGESR